MLEAIEDGLTHHDHARTTTIGFVIHTAVLIQGKITDVGHHNLQQIPLPRPLDYTAGELIRDIAAVLDRARRAGLRRLLTIGQGLEDSLASIELGRRYPEVSAAIGFGPHGSERVSGADFEKLGELTSAPEVVGLGEVGLDYHYDQSARDVQRTVFAEQVRLAAELGLPLVIHCRDAWEDCLDVLDKNSSGPLRGVFHCYTGSPDTVPQLIDGGFYISFAGLVTFSKADECRAAAKKVPLDRLLIETDAPCLSPEPVRKVRPNEPALMVHTVGFMAELLDLAPVELAEITTRNACDLFGW